MDLSIFRMSILLLLMFYLSPAKVKHFFMILGYTKFLPPWQLSRKVSILCTSNLIFQQEHVMIQITVYTVSKITRRQLAFCVSVIVMSSHTATICRSKRRSRHGQLLSAALRYICRGRFEFRKTGRTQQRKLAQPMSISLWDTIK